MYYLLLLDFILRGCYITYSTHIQKDKPKIVSGHVIRVEGNTQHHALYRYVTRGFIFVHRFAAVR